MQELKYLVVLSMTVSIIELEIDRPDCCSHVNNEWGEKALMCTEKSLKNKGRRMWTQFCEGSNCIYLHLAFNATTIPCCISIGWLLDIL